MQRVLVGIFAHPDDEAFGPSATLMREVDNGTDLYLICVTCGEGGANNERHADLAAVRTREWREAAAYMGAKGTYALKFPDGELCNRSYHELADILCDTIGKICDRYSKPIELRLMTLDPNGLTGHLDHIAVAYVTTYLFYKLKENPLAKATMQELAYYCLSLKQKPTRDEAYFVYSPPGRPADFINRTISSEGYLERKFAVMRMHRSQQHDAEVIMGFGEAFHAADHFHVLT